MRSASQSAPWSSSWDVGPCWYKFAPSALVFGISVFALTALTGCNSSPRPKVDVLQKPVSNTATYPSRPTTPPPSFKVFHQTADSITLVTKDNATDDEIAAIIWQLRDAAHNNSFDKLKISQKFIDARDPKIWFHIYRGAKCASEKFTTGKLPCDASYHGAGDYTLGSFSKKDFDDGVLIHADHHETHLWDPDAPYIPLPTT